MPVPLDHARVPQTGRLPVHRLRTGPGASVLPTTANMELDYFTWLASRASDPAALCRELRPCARPTDLTLTLASADGPAPNVHLTFRTEGQSTLAQEKSI